MRFSNGKFAPVNVVNNDADVSQSVQMREEGMSGRGCQADAVPLVCASFERGEGAVPLFRFCVKKYGRR